MCQIQELLHWRNENTGEQNISEQKGAVKKHDVEEWYWSRYVYDQAAQGGQQAALVKHVETNSSNKRKTETLHIHLQQVTSSLIWKNTESSVALLSRNTTLISLLAHLPVTKHIH